MWLAIPLFEWAGCYHHNKRCLSYAINTILVQTAQNMEKLVRCAPLRPTDGAPPCRQRGVNRCRKPTSINPCKRPHVRCSVANRLDRTTNYPTTSFAARATKISAAATLKLASRPADLRSQAPTGAAATAMAAKQTSAQTMKMPPQREHLDGHLATLRMGELRQEREKEDRHLGVGNVHQHRPPVNSA